jgi:hypothetical protein
LVLTRLPNFFGLFRSAQDFKSCECSSLSRESFETCVDTKYSRCSQLGLAKIQLAIRDSSHRSSWLRLLPARCLLRHELRIVSVGLLTLATRFSDTRLPLRASAEHLRRLDGLPHTSESMSNGASCTK